MASTRAPSPRTRPPTAGRCRIAARSFGRPSSSPRHTHSCSRVSALPVELASSHYVPPPVDTWQLYAGFLAGLFPFILASYEFGKRLLIQKQCAVCGGCGLVSTSGAKPRMVKCKQCGGFLPWQSWERFLTSEVGNGGPLRQPRDQKSVLYDVDAARQASLRAAQRRDEAAPGLLEVQQPQESASTDAQSTPKERL